MHQTTPEILVEIHKLRNRFVAVTKDSLGREILRNEFQHATTHLTYLGPPWLVDQERLGPEERGRLSRFLRDNVGSAQVSLQGWHLFQYLFGDGRDLRRHLAALRDEQAALRDEQARSSQSNDETAQMTLLFSPGASSLSRLPWEYIFDGKQFPCLEGRLLISRRPLDVTPLTTQPTDRPLHLLLVIPAPGDQVAFDAEHELSIVQDALAPLIQRGALVMHLLPEPTANALFEALGEKDYDVVHYIGHGIYQLPQHQGYLCFEDDFGRSALVSGVQLPRFAGVAHQRARQAELGLKTGTTGASPYVSDDEAGLRPCPPRLFVISACQNAQIGVFDAVQSVANDLLHRGFPSVLGIPLSLRTASALAFYRAFFGSLAGGEAVLSGLSQGRRALRDIDRGGIASSEGPSHETDKAEQRFDWGVPVLHQRASALVLTGPLSETVVPSKAETPRGSEAPKLAAAFLPGRHREIQAVRRALAANARVFYILGGDGVGKHAFTSYVLDHLGTKPSACLRINCREVVEPLSALGKIADFWRGEVGPANVGAGAPDGTDVPINGEATQAAGHLLDSRAGARERAQKAQALLARKRTLLLFENIDAWFTPDEAATGELQSNLLRDVLIGLMAEPSRGLFFFTGNRRWEALAEIPPDDQREIRLPLLSERYAIQLINQLPALRAAASTQAEKLDVYHLVGGHPLILRHIDRWLAFGNILPSLADIGPEPRKTTEDWLFALTGQLLDHLDPGEYQVLGALAVLKLPFDASTIASLTQVTLEQARPLLAEWQRLSLVAPASRKVSGADAYNLVASVRKCLLDRLSPLELTALHRRAAEAYGAPFFDAAQRQVLARTITVWSEERIGWLARDANGILGLRLRREVSPEAQARLIEQALAWQDHLLQAGETEAAAQIVQALAPELNRHGQHDLSRKLLQQTLPPPKGPAADQQLDTLTRLRLEEGPLTAALRVYQEVYRSLDPETEVVQRTYVMLRAGHIHQRLGNLAEAVAHYQTALQIIRRQEVQEGAENTAVEQVGTAKAVTVTENPKAADADEEAREGSRANEVRTAEAECLYHLARAYREMGTLREALVCSQAAKEHYQALANPVGHAALEYEQGLILKLMDRTDSALERFIASLRLCRETGDQQCMADNLTEIGQLFDQLGKTDMAIQVIEEAIEHYEYLRSPQHGRILSLLEELYAKQKRLAEAITRFRTIKRAA